MENRRKWFTINASAKRNDDVISNNSIATTNSQSICNDAIKRYKSSYVTDIQNQANVSYMSTSGTCLNVCAAPLKSSIAVTPELEAFVGNRHNQRGLNEPLAPLACNKSRCNVYETLSDTYDDSTLDFSCITTVSHHESILDKSKARLGLYKENTHLLQNYMIQNESSTQSRDGFGNIKNPIKNDHRNGFSNKTFTLSNNEANILSYGKIICKSPDLTCHSPLKEAKGDSASPEICMSKVDIIKDLKISMVSPPPINEIASIAQPIPSTGVIQSSNAEFIPKYGDDVSLFEDTLIKASHLIEI